MLRTVFVGLVTGAILGLTADLLSSAGPRDMETMAKVIGLSAGKGAFIAWLVPRTIPWLAVALAIGAVFSAFFWTAVPARGSFPEDALRWWNLAPGALLGILLVLRSRKKAAAAARKAARDASLSSG